MGAAVGASAGPKGVGADTGAAVGAKVPKPPADTGALVAALTPMVREMLQVVAEHKAQKDVLAPLAKAAQDSLRHAMLSLKPDDLQRTEHDIEALRKGLDEAKLERTAQAGASKAGEAIQAASGVEGKAAAGPHRADAARGKPTPDGPHVLKHITGVTKHAVAAVKANPQIAGPLKAALAKAQTAYKAGDFAGAMAYSGEADGIIGGAGPIEQMGIGGAGAAVPQFQPAEQHGHGGKSHGPNGVHAAQKAFVQKTVRELEELLHKGEAEVKHLYDRFTKSMSSHPAGPKIVKHFDHSVFGTVRSVFGTVYGVTRAVGGLAWDVEEAVRKKAATAVSNTLHERMEFIRKHPVLAALETNPIVPVRLVEPMILKMQELHKALHGAH